jgi:hypothetical protein
MYDDAELNAADIMSKACAALKCAGLLGVSEKPGDDPGDDSDNDPGAGTQAPKPKQLELLGDDEEILLRVPGKESNEQVLQAARLPAPVAASKAAATRSRQIVASAVRSLVEELNGRDQFAAALTRSESAISAVLFTSPVCRKCRAFVGGYQRMAMTKQADGMDTATSFYSVNAIKNLALYESESIGTLPTVVFYVGQQMVDRVAIGKEIESGVSRINKLISELQSMSPQALLARAECARASAQTAAEEQASASIVPQIAMGALATGGAAMRLLGAMGGGVAVADLAPGVSAGLAECALECESLIDDIGFGGLAAA